MDDQITLLKELQELDQKLNRIDQDQHNLEAERRAMDAEVVRIREMMEALQESISETEGKLTELRQALDREQANVVKAEKRLPEIKTQKEYLAVLKEVDAAKKMVRDLTEQSAQKRAEIQGLQQEVEEKQQTVDALESQSFERRREIEEALKSFEGYRQSLAEQRQAQLKPLPRNLQRNYQLLVERRGGIAVVEARNGTCHGCNMHLPPQLFNSLLLAQDIKTCPHCNRLLFVVRDA